MNHDPLVSICIPLYNSEKTIKKTIESVINQTYTHLEIIVIDNHSTDSSVQIVQEYKDSRIKLILHDVHLPCAEYNWNRCFRYVSGEYMAIFHADDVYSADIVSRQIEIFKEEKATGGVFTLGYLINDDDEVTGVLELPYESHEAYRHTYSDLLSRILEYGDFIPTPTAMLPTRVYQKIAPFNYEAFGSASDLDMWLRAADINPVLILPEKLFSYRISDKQGSFTINHLRVNESDIYRVLDHHIQKNRDTMKIPQYTLDKYELYRLDDMVYRAGNSFLRNDKKTILLVIKRLKWKDHIRIMMKHPKFLRWVLGSYAILSGIILRISFKCCQF
jgi:glycosyltransferase involved in cell wall biosynthesis